MTRILLLALLGSGACLLLAQNHDGPPHSRPLEPGDPLVYHNHAPTQTLPETLDPAQFADNHEASVAYAVAARTKATLYQVPCYCPCPKLHGHTSLLDCFTSKHGSHCHICQQEALFCYLSFKTGKSPEQIRDAIARGEAWKVDVSKCTLPFENHHPPE